MKLKILYGSETGTTYYEAQTLTLQLKSLSSPPLITLESLNNYNFQNIITDNYLIILISTTGQGEFPRNARNFWENLLIDFPKDTLKNLNFAIFGFGDSSYANFNTPALLVDFRLRQLGARSIGEIGLGDDSKDSGYFEDLKKWKKNIFMEIFDGFKGFGDGRENLYFFEQIFHGFEKFEEKKFFEEKGFMECNVLESKLISAEDHFQEIYCLKVEIPENKKYVPGDLVSVYYINPDEIIDKILPFINIKKEFLLKENKKYQKILDSKINNKKISPKNLLKYIFDIQKPPNFNIIKKLKKYTTGIYSEKITEMTYEDYHDYIIKENRQLHEILFDFKIKKIPLSLITNNYPFTRPRQYSISSSHLKTPKTLQIVYNLINYKTKFKRQIKGICTSYLKSLKKGHKINLKIEKGLFQYKDFQKPTIMICTGTGIAPFLSFLRESDFLKKLEFKKNLLVFGCRLRNKDFIERDFLEDFEANEKLKCFFAFSREKKEKFYVQHFFKKERDFFLRFFTEFFEEIRIFVCGNSKFLALSVEKGIRGILLEVFEGDVERVNTVVKEWIKNKRLCYELYS